MHTPKPENQPDTLGKKYNIHVVNESDNSSYNASKKKRKEGKRRRRGTALAFVSFIHTYTHIQSKNL